MPSFLLALCCLIGGHVEAANGAPVAHARIVLSGPKHIEAQSDAKGDFSVEAPPGRYTLKAYAPGFAPVEVVTGDIASDSRIDVTLDPADSPKLRTIGAVTVNGGFTLQRSGVPEVDIPRAQMDELGYSNVVEALGQVPSLVLQHPDAGSATAPDVVSLRGPDPSEALVTLDGHPLNDGNTGDVDLSQFAVPAFNSVNVTEGLGPSDSEISNTFGGAVNFVSLQPTQKPHLNLSGSIGSYGTSQTWLNATGSAGKLGYAFAVNNYQQAGQVDETVAVAPLNNTPIDCATNTNCPVPTHLGSTISSRLGVAGVQYNFSQQADAGLRIFSLGDTRDESSALNGIAGNAFVPCDPTSTAPCSTGFTNVPNPDFGAHIGAGSAVFAQNIRAYDAYSRSVLGAGSLIADVFTADNAVDFSGASTGVTPYDVSHHDKRAIEALSWERVFDKSDLTLGAYWRQESLAGDGIDSTQSQSIASYFVRGDRQLGKLRLSGGLYDADYSTFGRSIDWRLGTSYDLDSSSVVRASFGTGFRAPLLIERYYFPQVITNGSVQPNPGLPPADSNCVVAGQGNPNEKAEHATEYELGYSKLFSSVSNLDFSLYRSNLRDTIENYYPGYSCDAPNGFAYEIPINIGNAVYEGAELRLKQLFPRQNLLAVFSYGLNVAYPYALGPNVSNPTSGGTLVDHQPFLSVPQQQGSISVNWAHAGWHAATAFTFAGRNNALNQAPYTLTDAAVGRSFGHVDLTLAATNIFNAVSGPFTIYGAGVPYQGLYASSSGGTYLANVPTDRLNVLPASLRVILTIHE